MKFDRLALRVDRSTVILECRSRRTEREEATAATSAGQSAIETAASEPWVARETAWVMVVRSDIVHSNSRWTGVVLCTLALFPQWLASRSLPPIVTNDSVWYLGLTRFFPSSRPTDYYSAGPPVQYDIPYPFGYPLFLDLCKLGVSMAAWAETVVAVQHILTCVTGVLLWAIGKRLGYAVGGALAAVAYAFYLPRVIYAQTLMAETLFTFLLVLSVYLWIRSTQSAGWKWAAGWGLVFGCACATKPLALVGIPVLGFFAWQSCRSPRSSAAFVGSSALVLAAAVGYNLVLYEHAGLTTFTGRHFSDRVFAYDGLVDPEDPDTRYIVERCETSGLFYRFPGFWWDYLKALRTDGSAPAECDRRIFRAAIAGVRTDIPGYLLRTGQVLLTNVVGEDVWIPYEWYWRRDYHAAYLRHWVEEPHPLFPAGELDARRVLVENVRMAFPDSVFAGAGRRWMQLFNARVLKWRGAAAWFFLLGFLGAFATRNESLWRIAVLVIVVSLGAALLEAPYPRYFESLLPLALVLSFACTEHLLRRLARKSEAVS